jgi:hypothetical protein
MFIGVENKVYGCYEGTYGLSWTMLEIFVTSFSFIIKIGGEVMLYCDFMLFICELFRLKSKE